MNIYSCNRDWESMLTCIYEAWTSKKGHENIKLVFEPIEQYSLLDQYFHVDADIKKAESVINAINNKISPFVYRELAFCSMAYEDDVMDNIYRVLLLGFSLGSEVLNMVHYKDVMRNRHIRCRVGKELNRFQEVVRFHQIPGNVYVSHIEPKSRIVVGLGDIFQDRMPSEHWMIIDDVHKEAVIHPKDQDYYIKQLDEQEFSRLLETEEMNDSYTDMWQAFFNSIAIEERYNPKCQRNLFPIWARKHAVEFNLN